MAASPADAAGVAVRRVYAIAATTCVLFAVWGSLFPFDFHRVPLATAVAQFWNEWGRGGAVWSLSDLVSNVLLFVPIGLFLAAAAAKTWPHRIAAAAAGAFAATLALSVAVEFGQAFVSSRTPSAVDVAAEAAGAAAGIVLWRILGAEVDALAAAGRQLLRRSTLVQHLLFAYCALFALAWLVPADVTLRPGEIGDKYLHQRLLLPLTPSVEAATPMELWITAAAAIPLGAAGVLCGCRSGARRSVPSGMAITGLSLIALEAGQITVFSRTTDTTSLLAAAAGAVAGAVAAGWSRLRRVATGRLSVVDVLWPLLTWITLTAFVAWWPFDFVLNPAAASVQTMLWSLAPFRLPAGPSTVVPGVVLALATGLWLGRRLTARFVRLQTLLVLTFGSIVFLGFETGRLLLAAARPTLVTVLLETTALGVGLQAGQILTPLVISLTRRHTS